MNNPPTTSPLRERLQVVPYYSSQHFLVTQDIPDHYSHPDHHTSDYRSFINLQSSNLFSASPQDGKKVSPRGYFEQESKFNNTCKFNDNSPCDNNTQRSPLMSLDSGITCGLRRECDECDKELDSCALMLVNSRDSDDTSYTKTSQNKDDVSTNQLVPLGIRDLDAIDNNEVSHFNACPFCHRPFTLDSSSFSVPGFQEDTAGTTSKRARKKTYYRRRYHKMQPFFSPHYFRQLARIDYLSRKPPAEQWKYEPDDGKGNLFMKILPARAKPALTSRSLWTDVKQDEDIRIDDNEGHYQSVRSNEVSPPTELGPREQAPPPTLQDMEQGYYNVHFEEVQKIGQGAFGGVFVCRHIVGGEDMGLFVVKKIPIGNDVSYLKQSLREVRLLEATHQHANVVEYHHSWIDYAHTADFGPIVRCLFILQEFATEGSLDNYLEKSLARTCVPRRRRSPQDDILEGLDSLSNAAVWYFFLSAVAGIAHLHSNGVLHRDLKPQNLLLTKVNGLPPRLMVGDFGTATLLSEMVAAKTKGSSADIGYARTGTTGTMGYMAPELFVRATVVEDNVGDDNRGTPTNNTASAENTLFEHTHTKSSDVWSLGAILHYLAFGSPPVIDQETGEVFLPKVNLFNEYGLRVHERNISPSDTDKCRTSGRRSSRLMITPPLSPGMERCITEGCRIDHLSQLDLHSTDREQQSALVSHSSKPLSSKDEANAKGANEIPSDNTLFTRTFSTNKRPPEMIELMRLMLSSDPRKRPSCQEILKAPFIQAMIRKFEVFGFGDNCGRSRNTNDNDFTESTSTMKMNVTNESLGHSFFSTGNQEYQKPVAKNAGTFNVQSLSEYFYYR
eukprot:Tbor_TRINITY_DN4882_c0_g1::TRINITY_DN4882_c0_g1_i1::g.1462::m.1462